MKTAYELALERMEAEGIERPDPAGLTEEVRAEIEEARQRARARLAEVEILHRKALAQASSPTERERLEAEYRIDRERIERDRDRAIGELRKG